MKQPTEAQRAARTRNWAIRKLRAYYHLCPAEMGNDRARQIKDLVDQALVAMGAEAETPRYFSKLTLLDNLFNERELHAASEQTDSPQDPGDHEAPDPDFQV